MNNKSWNGKNGYGSRSTTAFSGGTFKSISVALFAGYLVLSANTAYAADEAVPTPILDELHNSGTQVPGTSYVYPSSEYTLTEVMPEDPENLAPNIIKYSDPNNITEGVHYYEVGLKNSVFGEGSSEKYYTWAKDSNGVKLVETSDSSQAVLTLKYDPNSSISPIVNQSGESLDLVKEIYVVQDIKNAISASGVINNISSTFEGNSLEITKDDSYNYSSIIAEYNGHINNINSSFIGNSVEANTDSAVYGTLVKGLSGIDNIVSEFVGNSISTDSARINGGLVEFSSAGSLNKLSSDFLLNGVNSVNGDIEGAVLASDGRIEGIDTSKFVGNYGISQSGSVYGGAVWNNGTINNLTNTVFAGNSAQTDSGTARGGAIYNRNVVNIENSIFTDNYASSKSGTAQGGAIYTDVDMQISANNGKTTEFTGNYVENNGVKENQAIYVDSRSAVLTLNATDNGRILMNDVIDGVEGYRLLLGGDGTGLISLFNQINNAEIVAQNGASIDFADGNYLNYDFLSLTSNTGATYRIDADFGTKTSDKLTLGANSSGIIYLDDINMLGTVPDTSTVIQILTAPDTISIGLTQDLIDKFSQRTEGDTYEVKDKINATSKWSDEYLSHTMQDVTTTGIKTAITDSNRTTADSIEFTVENTTEEVLTESQGDTLKLLAQELTGSRKFNASSADETYTLTENTGKITTGGLTIEGYRDSATGNKATINTGNYSLVEVGNGASVRYSNININGTNTNDGSVLTVDEGGTATLTAFVDIASSAENGIVNDGTLIFEYNSQINSNTGITGDGTLSVRGVFNLTDGADIVQDTINWSSTGNIDGDITANNLNIYGGTTTLGENSVLTADLVNLTGGTLTIGSASNLHADVSSKATLNLGSGTLTSNIAGGSLNIRGDVVNNAVISATNLYLRADSQLTTNADNLQSQIQWVDGGGSLVLTGGTTSKNIAAITNVTGDVTLGASANGTWSVAEGASITTAANYIMWANNMQNSGTINITGGAMTSGSHAIQGGVVNITGDVTNFGSLIVADTLHVQEGASIQLNGDALRSATIINDAVIRVTGGNIGQNNTVKNPITGKGYFEFISGTTSTSNVTIKQDMYVKDGAVLIANMGQNLGADVYVEEGGIFEVQDNGSGTSAIAEGINITGDGQVRSNGSKATNNGYIDVAGGISVTYGVFATNADNIASDVNATSTIRFTGGTIDGYTVSGTGLTQINGTVISNEIISTTKLQVYDKCQLTIDADNIGSTNVEIRSGANLILGDGDIDFEVSGGTVSIAGNVNTTDKRVQSAVTVLEGGVLTAEADLLRNDDNGNKVTNNGDLYLSGNLNKILHGTGVTHIDNELNITTNTSNLAIEGTLDLNNGTLITDVANNTIRNFKINKATGTGDIIFNVNLAATTKADKITLSDAASDAIFKFNADKLNFVSMPTPETETDYGVIQVLFGGTGAKLQLDGDGSFSVAVEKSREDEAKADVYFDENFSRYHTDGVVKGQIELATTVSENDSIRIYDVVTTWDEEEALSGNLLRAWNQMSTEDERFFRFKTAGDIYNVPADDMIESNSAAGDLGNTTSGVLNIVGAADADNGTKSTIDMNYASGFNMTNANTTLNISDVTIQNAKDFIIKSTQATNSIGTVSEDGTVSGGLVNVSIVNNSASYTTTADTIAGIVYVQSGTISQIVDSEFKNNTNELTNSDTQYSAPYLVGSALSLVNVDVGSTVANADGTYNGGIINTVFENNKTILNDASNVAMSSAVALRSGSVIANIKDSVFRNNSSVSTAGSSRGALTLDSSTIHNIENTQFINNTAEAAKTNSYGGALYVVNNSVVDSIKNSLFDNNSVSMATGTTYYGGAIYTSSGVSIGEIIGTTFSNNSAYTGGAIYTESTKLGDIINSKFIGNTAAYAGGAAYLYNYRSSNVNIKDSLFQDNKSTASGGALFLNAISVGDITGTDFIGNTITNSSTENIYGGALYITNNSSVENIKDVLFENNGINSTGTNNKYGGALFSHNSIGSITDTIFKGNYIINPSAEASVGAFDSTSSIGTMQNVTFENNYVEGKNGVAGAFVKSGGSIGDFSNITFRDNHAKHSTNSGGGGMYISSVSIDNFSDVLFENNYAHSGTDNARGGAMYANNSNTFGNFENVIFKNNYAKSDSAKALGGALYIGGNNTAHTNFTNGIVNSTFIGNYVDAKSSANALGGAICLGSWQSLDIVAKDDGETLFKDNYKIVNGDESTKVNQAIYLLDNTHLTLDANTGGTIFMYDRIDAQDLAGSNVNVYLTGDETGTIKLYNAISGVDTRVTADSVNIDMANNDAFDYSFARFTSEDSAKFTLDFDRTSGEADNFTVGANSSGIVFIDELNDYGESDVNKTVQIINAKDDQIQLKLNSDNIHLETDIIENLGDTVYNDKIYHQNEGYTLATTKTTNDSITYLADRTYDGLDLITKSTLNEIRNFNFNTNQIYTVTTDLSTIATGTMNINGLEGDTLSVIDFDGHKAFTLANTDTLNISNTKITGAKDNLVIDMSTARTGAELNLDNTIIDGDIKSYQFANININGDTEFTGTISGANVYLNDGTLSMAQDTFQSANDLTTTGGSVSLDNNQIETYQFSILRSDANTNYSIDLDLDTQLADMIHVNSTSSSGTVTLSNVNFLNDFSSEESEFTVQIIDAHNSNLQLALDDNLNNYRVDDISRVEADAINQVTMFSDTYYNRNRNGVLWGELSLATTNTTNDSVKFNLVEDWEDSTTIVNSMGDTLKLVAGAEGIRDKVFLSADATESYQVTDDIGKIAQGDFTIRGTVSDNDMSAVNFRNHEALEVGADTTLNVNNVRLTGAENVITVTDPTGIVNLSGAYVNGNIIGTDKFNLNVSTTGSNVTTINGIVENANVTLSRGEFAFSQDTFASENSNLVAEAGYVSMSNGVIENYVISNLSSSDRAGYYLDIDLANQVSDTITTGSSSTGVIVLENFNFTGMLSDIDVNDEYTIKILNAQNDNIRLELSETLQSALVAEIQLGTDHVISAIDDIQAHSKWDDKYNVTVQDYNIMGRLNLSTTTTENDSLHLYDLRRLAGETQESLGDTLKLVNQLDTTENRIFEFDSSDNRYELSDYLGSTTSGSFEVRGVASQDAEGNLVTSTIDMNSNTGFVVDKADTELIISNVTFENLNYRDGSLINISDGDGIANLNNVIVSVTNSSNAIINNGTLNMTGGEIVLNTGITGKGISNVSGGADVSISDGIQLSQEAVNVENGSLVLGESSVIRGNLTIGNSGSVTTSTNGITSEVSNDGDINFTDGILAHNITGSGTTNILGDVVNDAQISQDVDVQSGQLTTSADNISGTINNEAELLLNGKLTNTVTGSGTTTANESLILANGAGFSGTLNMNSAVISTADNIISNYNIGTMQNTGSFTIDIDLASNTADKFITGNTSKGTIYIDSLNFQNIGAISESTKIQILDSNGTDEIQLALNSAISGQDFVLGRVSRDEQDTVNAVTSYDDVYHTYERGGDLYGSLTLGQTETANDSIVVNKGETQWDENRTETGLLGDTLALWNQLETDQDKEFNFDETATYTLTSDLGDTNGSNLSINGVSVDGEKSTVDLDNHTGFVLDDASNLTIKDTKLTNSNGDLIIVSNSDANISLNDAYIDGDISGSQNYDVLISGDDVTTLNGKLSNANTTLNGGALLFNTDTFAASNNKLTAVAGDINLSNSSMSNYTINELESNADVNYAIDINFADKTSDKITAGDGSTGTVTLSGLNILGSLDSSNPVGEDYKIQILETPTSDLQLALSDALKAELEQVEYLVKTEYRSADAEIKAVNNWDTKYYQTDYTVDYYGKLGLTTTDTENDSIGIIITRNEETPSQGASMGDTLALVNQFKTEENRELNFDAASNVYNVSGNLGQTTDGSLSINGVSSSDGSEKSTVDLNGYTGFELANDTELNLKDIKFTGNDTLINVSNSNSSVNIKDSYLDGDITGTTSYNITVNGDDITTFNGTVSNADTILNGGWLKFNSDTFASSNDRLTANNGSIYLDDGNITDYRINELLSEADVKYSIDVNLTDETSDKIILTSEDSSGTVLIDSIDFLNNETPTKEFTVQILESNNDSIQIDLSEELKNQRYQIGTDHKEWDDLKSTISFDEFFHDYAQDGIKYGKLNEATVSTTNDSIALKYDSTTWGETTSVARADTLKELNVYQTTEEKNFNFKTSTDSYAVKEDLGVTTGQTLNINGVSDSETQKSTIDLDTHNGFELANDTTLNISDTKLTGNNDTLITVTNSDANINLENSYIEGNITGSEQYNVQISGNDVTTIKGQLVNAETTLTSGTLKIDADTLADSSTSLNAQGGNVSLSDSRIDNYVINDLTSSNDVTYSLDINLSDKHADTITVNSGSGTITLDKLNITGSVADPSVEYKIQILDTPNSDIQLALSEALQGELGQEEYLIGSKTDITYDKVKEVTNWKDIYNEYSQDFFTYGKLGLATTDTENDSIGITVSKTTEGEIQTVGPMGDTLRVVNNSGDVANKTFEFDTVDDEYKVTENLGITVGTVNIAGVSNGEKYSTINMDAHSGFETPNGSVLNISNTAIKNAKGAQGAVINAQDSGASINLTNVSLTNNVVTGDHGAAVYSNSDIKISSNLGNTVIKDNKTSQDDEAVYMAGTSKLTLQTVNNGTMHIWDKINGNDGYKVVINGDKSGSIYLNNQIKNAEVSMDSVTLNLSGNNHFETSNMTVNSGTLNLVNNLAQQQLAKSFTVTGNFNLNADVDLNKEIMDRLPSNTKVVGNSYINVDRLNLLSDTQKDSVAIPFADEQFKGQVKYVGASELSKDTQITTAYAPIYKYSLTYENRDDLGYFVFTKGGGASSGSFNAYNPAVLASPVAAQVGGYAAMNETFNYAFKHSDLFSMLPRSQRMAVQYGNQYSINAPAGLPVQSSIMQDRDIWVQPYANFESIELSNGPKVNVTSYGTLVGGDSEYMRLRNGWGTVTTAYAGYNGSYQSFSGVSTTQNGGVLGVTQTFYKNNFFTALTASAGASVGESNTMYGNENFTMLMAGVASKTGYNFEFKEGKYIIQPSMLMSYTFVNTFNYTNAAGVGIDSDPLHTIQLRPNIKFAANLKHGWQPYASVSMVWNIMNDTKFAANNVALPEMSIKPYVEYGVGVQKTWNDNFTGYLQAMVRNGGRNGVALSTGFRWALGKDGDPIERVQNTDSRGVVIKTASNSSKTVNKTKSVANNLDAKNSKTSVSQQGERKIIKQLSPQQKMALSKKNYNKTTYSNVNGVMKQL